MADSTKHPGGRPLKYATPEDMQLAIDDYFSACDNHVITISDRYTKRKRTVSDPMPYTMTGLARTLGFESRSSLVNYKRRDKFMNTIKEARMRVEESVESRLLKSTSPVAGPIFNLKNNFDGWHDKQEIDHTSKGKSIAPKVVSEVAPRTKPDAPTQAETT
jgi:hypothetical protein